MDNIIRIEHHDRPFTIIDNSIFEHPRLSLQAKTILCYLISRPRDWVVHMSQLQTISPGVTKGLLRRVFKELRREGYAHVKAILRNEKTRGRFSGRTWTIFEQPKIVEKCKITRKNNGCSEEHSSDMSEHLNFRPNAVGTKDGSGTKDVKGTKYCVERCSTSREKLLAQLEKKLVDTDFTSEEIEHALDSVLESRTPIRKIFPCVIGLLNKMYDDTHRRFP